MTTLEEKNFEKLSSAWRMDPSSYEFLVPCGATLEMLRSCYIEHMEYLIKCSDAKSEMLRKILECFKNSEKV